ncbi:MAG TPA: aminopeptidase P family protein [Saprospiraceae bacterium]|nr:aminopeptidase P family protein [Saprospiraceae bacterium]HMP25890.1 aminopeptidase P family protein [Saprospiraceae bacterium]
MFHKNTYTQRRAHLQQAIASGLILLPGHTESPINCADNTYPFRQDSNFLYYIGIDQPNLAALIDADTGATTLFGNDFTMNDIVWMGPQPALTELAAAAGIETTQVYNDLAAVIQQAQAQGRPIHFLPPYRGETKILLSHWLQLPLPELAAHVSIPFIKAVVAQRAVKTDEEIAEIEQAVNISGRMHVAAMQNAHPGIREAVLRGLVEGLALSEDCSLAYAPIITVHGQTLHNHHYGNTLQKGQLLLGDFGSESPRRYAGDITRTFPVDKTFTSQQRAIYNIVLAAENQSIEAIKPGVPYRQVHLLAATIITEGLKSIGLMQGDTAQAVQAGAHALFFPHGLGHMLGLDVHDMEDLGEDHVGYDPSVQRSDQFGLRSLRLARALQPGFVLTVEPGIYFIPELIDAWQAERRHAAFIRYDKLAAYRHFGGIRIEDNVLVTPTGSRVLGHPIPKTAEAVEAIRSQSGA